MNKKCRALVIACFIMATASAQTLFTYGSYSADAKDFLRAFNKNNTATAGNKAKAMRDYLDLYIASRLKIREAYNRHYDTLPQIKNDIENLRSQIIENYLSDPQSTDKLVKEAFQRGQKDIHLGHIYISYKNKIGVIDTAEAENKIKEVYEKLKKGEGFGVLAEQYSSDPSAKTNKGDIGYVTVFSLPYEFENIVYNTALGKFSAPYKSRIGFHIFKNLDERKAVGQMKAEQILLAFPPNADEAAKKQVAALADSLYQRLLKGDEMAKLAGQFSNDYISAASGGMMQEFGVGQYDPVFENVFLSLKKDGDISKPFLTSHGYHIIKRVGIVPPVTDAKDKAYMEELKSKVTQSDRMQAAKNAFIDKVLSKTPTKKYSYPERELWLLSDSLLDSKPSPIPVTLKMETPLLKLGDKLLTVTDYISYARVWRYKPDGSGLKPYKQIMDEFIRNQAENYYREHLEQYNEDFRNQMNEFKDGNLFFEIMQQEVWNKAQNDTLALQAYYQKNKSRYNWKESADAVIFFCGDEATAKTLYDKIKKDPLPWREVSDGMGEKVVADSSRYEFSQIPNAAKTQPSPGLVTAPLKNNTDGSVSFAYIIKIYPANMTRNFTEAKGLVVSDYQGELEKQWLATLKKKYPVKINETTWKQIVK